jgi:hypothetical protein
MYLKVSLLFNKLLHCNLITGTYILNRKCVCHNVLLSYYTKYVELFSDLFVVCWLTVSIIVVLEFELRKAQDTIKSLRASLTKEAGKIKKLLYPWRNLI